MKAFTKPSHSTKLRPKKCLVGLRFEIVILLFILDFRIELQNVHLFFRRALSHTTKDFIQLTGYGELLILNGKIAYFA